MLKNFFFFLLMIPIAIGLSSSVFAQIVVEDAGVIWEKDLDIAEFPPLPPRITVEYATIILDVGLIPPPDFDISSRIIVEYATAIAQFDPVSPYPEIDEMVFDSCISEHCTSLMSVTAYDPLEGDLTYSWEALDGGDITGTGADVAFDPPDSGPHPCPYHVEVTVTSSAGGFSKDEMIMIHAKLAGDVDGNGVVNVLDKVQVRNHFGESGDPGWIDADVNCDGVVNVLDKVQVRNQFGETGCSCPGP